MEMKPCPFCGSDAKPVERKNPMSKWKWSVDCSSCGMSGPVEASQVAAIAAWNKRGTVNQTTEREAFVSWLEKTDPKLPTTHDVEVSWRAWQARAEMLVHDKNCRCADCF